MEIRKGIPVSPGYAVGDAFLLDAEEVRIPKRQVRPDELEDEVGRFRAARDASVADLEESLRRKWKTGQGLMIIQAHIAMLKDPTLAKEVEEFIRRTRANAEYAVSHAVQKQVKKVLASPSELAQGIARNILDVERQILHKLLGKKAETLASLTQGVVVIAPDITPSQAALLDPKKVIALATDVGGKTSHTALLARERGIPAVVGLESITQDVAGGDTVIVDGSSGQVIVRPDEDTLKVYLAMGKNYRSSQSEVISKYRNLPAQTKDKEPVRILSNIERPAEIPVALDHGAKGIGLFRTEYLFFGSRGSFPTEEDHYEAYLEAVQQLGGREITIRTLDAGADKVNLDGAQHERNPFLGCRGIRLCFERSDLFKPQLRAILRVSLRGKVKIMFPMISTVEELRQAKRILEETMEELRREGIGFDEKLPVGIMVEVPAAAILADRFAPEVDFMSLGTNDLIQYTMAVDRGNERVASLYQPPNPAVLRLIRNVIAEGQKHGKTVVMCGEMSGDPVFVTLLLGMGLSEFSVVPNVIPTIKRIVREVTLKEAQDLAAKAMTMHDAREIYEMLANHARRVAPDLVP